MLGRVGFKIPLHKTRGFLEAHPFGTVPAAFSPDGKVGIFESNSIMRAVARLGEGKVPLYGSDPYEASRIDGFLDASLVFARDSQIYLLALVVTHCRRRFISERMTLSASTWPGLVKRCHRTRVHCGRPPDPG